MESDGGERAVWWTVMNGEGVGVGTDGRGGSAAGPSSSMCALIVCALVICVCTHLPVHRCSLCVGGALSLSKGGMLSSMGGGRQLWALGGCSIREQWSSFVGVGHCSWALGCPL